MQKELKQWSQQLKDVHLPRWEELPDFDLYSDQVIQLVCEYLTAFGIDDDNLITSSMINNYVKHKIIPKPEKKKYKKVHLAYLMAISLLKQVQSIRQVKIDIDYQCKYSGNDNAYNLFCEEIEQAIRNVYLKINGKCEQIDTIVPDERMAMSFVADSCVSKIIADKIVEISRKEYKGQKDE